CMPRASPASPISPPAIMPPSATGCRRWGNTSLSASGWSTASSTSTIRPECRSAVRRLHSETNWPPSAGARGAIMAAFRTQEDVFMRKTLLLTLAAVAMAASLPADAHGGRGHSKLRVDVMIGAPVVFAPWWSAHAHPYYHLAPPVVLRERVIVREPL